MLSALNCLDENSALDFLSGRLGAPALAETERHLGECGACVELLARAAPFLPSRHDAALVSAPRHKVSPAVSTVAMRPPRPSPAPAEAGPGRDPHRPRTLEGNLDESWFSRSPPGGGLLSSGFGLGSESDAGASISADGRARRDITGSGADDTPSERYSRPTLTPGIVLKDTYTVLGLIGRGGMGEVYEVAHSRLAGRYALKLLPPAFAHEHVSVTRFRREADITSAMRHPNIVQVIDFDHTPAGQPFLVMEYLDGGDLAQLMAATGPMPLDRTLRIVAQIVSALSAVHRRGIVHRDLKPQNVLLVRDDDLAADRVKLVDFGLSKRNETSLLGLQTSISRDRTLLGTPRYMAPEQATGRIDEIDATTDQFALGAMVYEMLTGVPAFTGDHIALLLYRIVSEEPEPLRSIVPDVPEHVETALRRALSKQRSDRFPSTSDFFEALAGYGEGSPLTPSERGAHAEVLGATPNWGRRTVTPGGVPPARIVAGMTAGVVAGTSSAPPDSIDAQGRTRTRTRRRRQSAFIVGLGAAVLLALAFPALRGRPPEEPPNRPAARAGSTAPVPSAREVPSAAPIPEAPSMAVPTPPSATKAAPVGVVAPPPASPTPGKAPASRADSLVARHPRGPKHQDGDHDGQAAARYRSPGAGQASPPVAPAPDEKPRGAPDPATVGRLFEEL